MKQYGFVPILDQPAAIALGFFDGVHRGHCAVIRRTIQSGFTPVVFTFSTESFFPAAKKNTPKLTTDRVKLQRLEQEGAQMVVNADFAVMKNMDAQEFADKMLFERMKAKMICCGEDFRFGKHAQGDAALLKRLAKRHQADVHIIPFLKDGDERISSSRIREALKQADLQTANRLLGYEYYWDLPVEHGKGQGRKYGFSTMNQSFPPNCLILRYGVYASVATIHGKQFPAITNIGVKPTVQADCKPLAETHVLNFNRDMYGQWVKVSLVQYLRPERRFASVDLLKQQVQADIQQAYRVFLKRSAGEE